MSALAGGAASALGGGKFANGAITASAGYVYNYLQFGGHAARAALRVVSRFSSKLSRFATAVGNWFQRTRSATERISVSSDAALAKGKIFFNGFKNTGSYGHVTRMKGRFTEFSVNVPGRVPGSFTRWVKVVNQNGKTVRLYHDTFTRTNQFVHRGVKVPRPERHVP